MCHISFEPVVRQNMGIHRVVKTGIFPSLEIGTKNQIFVENLTSAAQFQLTELSCYDNVIAGTTLTLHKSQVQCFAVMQ